MAWFVSFTLKRERTRHAARALPLRHRSVSGQVSGFRRLDYHHSPSGRTRTCDLGGLMPCPKLKWRASLTPAKAPVSRRNFAQHSLICLGLYKCLNDSPSSQVVVPAGIEPARRHYFQAHRRGTRTPSLTERNPITHGPVPRFPRHPGHGEGEMPLAKVLAAGCSTRRGDRYISGPTRPCHLLGIGIYRARLNPVLHRLHPCDLSAEDVFRFASRDA